MATGATTAVVKVGGHRRAIAALMVDARARAKCLLIEIGIEYIQMTIPAEATITNKGRAVINSYILNAECAGEWGREERP